jgi:hypothetical protein
MHMHACSLVDRCNQQRYQYGEEPGGKRVQEVLSVG